MTQKSQNQIQSEYFQKMLIQLEDNKLQEPDLYQLFQDMVNTGYIWGKPEIELHARMMIEKGLIKAPKNYIHRKVEVSEILQMQKQRKTSNLKMLN